MPPRRRLARVTPHVRARVVLHFALIALVGALAYHLWRWAPAGAEQSVTLSWASTTTQSGPARICNEECGAPYSRNGVCDDGRPEPVASSSYTGLQRPVLCDLGTDCADCGAFDAPAGEAGRWRPIAQIRQKNFTVFTRRADTPFTPFFMAYTDPKKDVDVSDHFANAGVVERRISLVWHKILSEGCPPQPGGQPGLVLDVGANFGWFTLLSAAAGCHVLAWEPVPYFAAFLKYGLLRSGLTQQVTLRENIVSDAAGQLEMVVPQRGIWGTAGIGGANLDKGIDNEGDYDHVVKTSERLDAVVPAKSGDALVLKIDVEGFEPAVLRGAKGLLLDNDRNIENIILEYSPGVAERAHNWTWFEQFPGTLLGLVRGGYTVVHLDDAQGGGDWSAPLPAFQEVTAEVLAHDLDDARRAQEGSLGCQPPGATALGDTFHCGAMPEGFDPHSFHSIVGHNTNIWAWRHRKGQRKPWQVTNSTASLFPLKHPAFFTPHEFGAAHRPCAILPPETQLAHRCRCTDPKVCGKGQEELEKLDKEGKLEPRPVQRPWHADKMDIKHWR